MLGRGWWRWIVGWRGWREGRREMGSNALLIVWKFESEVIVEWSRGLS